MSQLQQDPPHSELSPTPADAPNPLRSLHKMSTTAGVSSQDYVAINGAAVWAAVLGAVSLLALVNDVLLVVPVVAIIFGIVALRKISNSNGTESGRIWAILGILLAAGITVGKLAYELTETRRNSADKAVIMKLIEQLGDDVKAGRFDAAYNLFDSRFKENVDHERFVNQIRLIQNNAFYGKLAKLESNGRIAFTDTPEPDVRLAQTLMNIQVEKGEGPPRPVVVLRRENGTWMIEHIPDLFPPPKPANR